MWTIRVQISLVNTQSISIFYYRTIEHADILIQLAEHEVIGSDCNKPKQYLEKKWKVHTVQLTYTLGLCSSLRFTNKFVFTCTLLFDFPFCSPNLCHSFLLLKNTSFPHSVYLHLFCSFCQHQTSKLITNIGQIRTSDWALLKC